MTEPLNPAQLTDLVRRLEQRHAPDASTEIVVSAVRRAVDAVRMFGADAEILALAEPIAESDLRLRLGLDHEVARLDPERRERRSQPQG